MACSQMASCPAKQLRHTAAGGNGRRVVFFSCVNCPLFVHRTAKQVLEAAGAEGRLGRLGAGAAVLYGHTDSLFCHLPHVSWLQSWLASLLN